MTRVAVSLYDHRNDATEVMEQLREAGFDEAQIECIEPEPDTTDYTRRLHRPGPDESIGKEESLAVMQRLGIADDDARHYLDEIAAGKSLVAVKTEEEISGRARQIMNRVPAREAKETSSLDTPAEQPPVAAAHNPTKRRTGRRRRRSAPNTEIFELPSPRQRSEARRAEEEAGAQSESMAGRTVVTEDDEQQLSAQQEVELEIGEMSTRVAQERFKLYRPDLVRHYEEHYAALGEYDFDDYISAYRWGMALAANPKHKRKRWPEIEPMARRGWQQRMGVGWDRFREAARFGWFLIRGEQQKYGARR